MWAPLPRAHSRRLKAYRALVHAVNERDVETLGMIFEDEARLVNPGAEPSTTHGGERVAERLDARYGGAGLGHRPHRVQPCAPVDGLATVWVEAQRVRPTDAGLEPAAGEVLLLSVRVEAGDDGETSWVVEALVAYDAPPDARGLLPPFDWEAEAGLDAPCGPEE